MPTDVIMKEVCPLLDFEPTRFSHSGTADLYTGHSYDSTAFPCLNIAVFHVTDAGCALHARHGIQSASLTLLQISGVPHRMPAEGIATSGTSSRMYISYEVSTVVVAQVASGDRRQGVRHGCDGKGEPSD